MFAQNRALSHTLLVSAVALTAFAGSSLALGQAAPAQPAGSGSGTAAPALATTSITVLAVTGKVQFKSGPTANLAELKVGQRLVEGAEIFTGLNSIAQIKIGEGQVFTIDRIGRVLIKDAVKAAAGGKNTTVLQLPYGRVRFDVTSTKVANDVKIQTPDATLAVKGTHGVIEKIPGQPTRAYGGELNAGIVNIMYVGGINVDVSKSSKSSGDNVQPAANADAASFVQTEDKNSADDTSRESGGWTPSVGGVDGNDMRSAGGRYNKQFFPPHPVTQSDNPITGNAFVGVDRRRGGTVRLYDLSDSPSNTIAAGLSGFFGTPQGAALVETAHGPAVVAIDDSAGTGYSSGTMAMRQWNPGLKRWELLGTLAPLNIVTEDEEGGTHHVESAYVLDGLGNLGGHLYASGVNPALGASPSQTTGHFGLFELTYPSLRGGSFQAQQRMSFPMLSNGGGLTGANSRGTMFVAAQFNLHSGEVPGMVVLEVDPRNNYIANVWSVADGSFSTGVNGGQINSSFRPTGVAFLDGQVVVTGAVGNVTSTYTMLPSDANHPTPRITSTRTGSAAAAANGLAGEGGFNAAASFPLGAADRKVGPVPGVDPIWIATSYSRSVATSAAFRRMMRDTVLSVASNPAACATSTAINAGLSNAIGDHYNEASGVNAALSQFYSSLPANHPCFCNNPRRFGN